MEIIQSRSAGNSDSFVGQAMVKCCEESVKGVHLWLISRERLKAQLEFG